MLNKGYMKTKHDIKYRINGGLNTVIIPRGTKVIKTFNLPSNEGFWARNWQNMDEIAESWARNYGFHIEQKDVI